MAIGNVIVDLRNERNISQQKVAAAIGISQSTIAQIEKNRNEATASTIRKLAGFFGVSADYLLELEDDFGARSEQNNEIVIRAAQSSEETRLLDIYRILSPDMRATLWSLLETWSPTSTHKNKV